MKDYKQQLKEEYDKHFDIDTGELEYLGVWNWITTKLEEVETKTRQEAVEGFVEYMRKKHNMTESGELNLQVCEWLYVDSKEYLGLAKR